MSCREQRDGPKNCDLRVEAAHDAPSNALALIVRMGSTGFDVADGSLPLLTKLDAARYCACVANEAVTESIKPEPAKFSLGRRIPFITGNDNQSSRLVFISYIHGTHARIGHPLDSRDRDRPAGTYHRDAFTCPPGWPTRPVPPYDDGYPVGRVPSGDPGRLGVATDRWADEPCERVVIRPAASRCHPPRRLLRPADDFGCQRFVSAWSALLARVRS